MFWGCVITVVWSLVFGELYRLTNSVWPCVLMHAIEDGVPTMLFVTSGIIKLKQEAFFILDPIQGIVSLLLLLGVGIYLRRKRNFLSDCITNNNMV